MFGIDAGTPILNPGEAAILALGAVRKMPWEYQDEVALRQVMTLSLSFDHRLVDGEQGSRFLQDLGDHAGRSGHGPGDGLSTQDHQHPQLTTAGCPFRQGGVAGRVVVRRSVLWAGGFRPGAL